MENKKKLYINEDQFAEVLNLAEKAFLRVDRFMDKDDLLSIAESLRLAGGEFFPLPVILDISEEEKSDIGTREAVDLIFNQQTIASLFIHNIYSIDRENLLLKYFQTASHKHPGVRGFLELKKYFVSGVVQLNENFLSSPQYKKYGLSPQSTQELFKQKGWKTIAGFQTRNAPHLAHEYLQRIALEVVDGLFIHPLIGKKKAGDFTPWAVENGYRALIDNYFPKSRVVLSFLTTRMRYAGPREALFHALIRKNYGCTHFIVGRDHAGVLDFYGKYEAQDLAMKYQSQLGIHILALSGPFYCKKCGGIATERTCGHFLEQPEMITEISGTMVREMLTSSEQAVSHLLRGEVISALRGGNIFIDSY